MKIIPYLIITALVLNGIGCAGKGKKVTAVKHETARPAVWDGETRDECLRAIKKARVDARNGLYRMYIFGANRYDIKFARFLVEYLKTSHNIELVIFGSDDRERSKCYSNEMDKIILKTFGPEVLANAELEARGLFDSRK